MAGGPGGFFPVAAFSPKLRPRSLPAAVFRFGCGRLEWSACPHIFGPPRALKVSSPRSPRPRACVRFRPPPPLVIEGLGGGGRSGVFVRSGARGRGVALAMAARLQVLPLGPSVRASRLGKNPPGPLWVHRRPGRGPGAAPVAEARGRLYAGGGRLRAGAAPTSRANRRGPSWPPSAAVVAGRPGLRGRLAGAGPGLRRPPPAFKR